MIVSWLIVGVIVGMDEGSELGTPDGTYVGGAVAIIPSGSGDEVVGLDVGRHEGWPVG